MKQKKSDKPQFVLKPIDFKKVDKILFILLRSIGDVLLATPAIREIKKYLPQSSLDVVVDDYCSPIIDGNPWIDSIFKFIRPPKFLAKKKKFDKNNFNIARKIFTAGYDLVINFHGGPRSFFLTLLSHARYRVGFKVYYGSFLYNRRLPSPHYILDIKDKIHQVHRKLSLLRGIGVPINSDELEMPVLPENIDRVNQLLTQKGIDKNDRIISINIGATKRTKLWHYEKFAQLIDILTRDYNAKVILTGAQQELEYEGKILERCKNKPVSFVNRLDLKDLAALYSLSNIYIGCDTGPTHIAAAMKTPIVVIFGSSDYNIWWPHNVPHKIVRKDLACYPCDRCTQEREYCIDNIQVDDVLNAVTETISI
ncbi:glycosyltransferase family 9 protein [bacterium]|nr:glycosyltransferase family 9 protein [bacterium]